VSLGTSLEMTAEIENTGDEEHVYELALHTYLAVGDVEAIRIGGLGRTRFLDTTAACTVDDPVLGRRIRVAKRHARATVVWNPGLAKARTMPDNGEEAWRHFVCVETANCGPNAVRLTPGARHATSARVDVGQ
jgi:glucose-6-phosphate 1-epimerase